MRYSHQDWKIELFAQSNFPFVYPFKMFDDVYWKDERLCSHAMLLYGKYTHSLVYKHWIYRWTVNKITKQNSFVQIKQTMWSNANRNINLHWILLVLFHRQQSKQNTDGNDFALGYHFEQFQCNQPKQTNYIKWKAEKNRLRWALSTSVD